MFLGAVARPRWAHRHCTFDGKIGMFPFIKNVVAQRKSKNRDKGQMEMKPVDTVNTNVYREMLITQLIPTIIAKWPQDGSRTIFIQQDTARAHITQDDEQWQQHHEQGGFKFILLQQAPNSPDCNILNLRFFRSIQSLMHKKCPRT